MTTIATSDEQTLERVCTTTIADAASAVDRNGSFPSDSISALSAACAGIDEFRAVNGTDERVILQINLIQEGDPLVTGDHWAWDLARDMQMGALTTIAKVLSFLGSFWVILVAVLATNAYFLMRRRIA